MVIFKLLQSQHLNRSLVDISIPKPIFRGDYKMFKHKNRKSQAALEFLMTYGWVFIIIAAVFFVLLTMGIFSPQNLVGSQCRLPNGFSCSGSAFKIGTSQISIAVKNIGATSADGVILYMPSKCTNSTPVMLNTGDTKVINCTVNPGSEFSVGQSENLKLYLNWTSEGISHSQSATLVGTVEN